MLLPREVAWPRDGRNRCGHANIHDDMKGVPDLITRMSRMRFSCQVAVVSFACRLINAERSVSNG